MSCPRLVKFLTVVLAVPCLGVIPTECYYALDPVSISGEVQKVVKARHPNPTEQLSPPRALGLARAIGERFKPSLETILDAAKPGEDGRVYVKLFEDEKVTVWAIRWKPGQGTKVHDHADAGAGVYAVLGKISEDRYVSERSHAISQVLAAGQGTAVQPTHIHRIFNATDENATSIHVYSPPLREMTYYEHGENCLTRKGRWADDTP